MDTGKSVSTMGKRRLGFESVFTGRQTSLGLWQQRSEIENEDEFEDEDD